MFTVTLDTFLVSDTHFGHDNIVTYCNRPKNHEQVIVQNWNSVVSDEDDVLHLGDLIFNNARGSIYARQLRGRKRLLKGNHDSGSKKWFLDRGFEKLDGKSLNWTSPEGLSVIFSHEPIGSHREWDINIHGHIHNNGYLGHHEDQIAGLDLSRDYRNISIEVMDYTPVRLREVLYGGKYQSSQNVVQHIQRASA